MLAGTIFSSGCTFKQVNDNKKDNSDALIESTTEFKYYNIDKKDNGKYSITNSTGKIIFDDVINSNVLCENKLLLQITEENIKENLYYIYDFENETIIEFNALEVYPYGNSGYFVKKCWTSVPYYEEDKTITNNFQGYYMCDSFNNDVNLEGYINAYIPLEEGYPIVLSNGGDNKLFYSKNTNNLTTIAFKANIKSVYHDYIVVSENENDRVLYFDSNDVSLMDIEMSGKNIFIKGKSNSNIENLLICGIGEDEKVYSTLIHDYIDSLDHVKAISIDDIYVLYMKDNYSSLIDIYGNKYFSKYCDNIYFTVMFNNLNTPCSFVQIGSRVVVYDINGNVIYDKESSIDEAWESISNMNVLLKDSIVSGYKKRVLSL